MTTDSSLRLRVVSLALIVFPTQSLGAMAQESKPQPKVEGDLKRMQGEWVSTSKDGTQESKWTIKGNRLTLNTPTRRYAMTIEIVPTKAPEKAINFRVNDDSPSAPGTFVPGIYKFGDNDSLKLSIADKEGQRPSEFKADPGGTAGDTERSFVFDLKRPKPKEKENKSAATP